MMPRTLAAGILQALAMAFTERPSSAMDWIFLSLHAASARGSASAYRAKAMAASKPGLRKVMARSCTKARMKE
jgi:hypothetical protein